MWTESLLRQLVRIPGAKAAWSRIPLGSLATRIHFGVWSRPHYAYCVYAAAQQAKSLNLPRISVVEMGVAGGNGLVALESTANAATRYTVGACAAYVFHSGIGIPRPLAYRT